MGPGFRTVAKLVAAAILLNSDNIYVANAQLRDISGTQSGTDVASGTVTEEKKKLVNGVYESVDDFLAAAEKGPHKASDVIDPYRTGIMKGHGHAKGDGPEKITEVQADDHHERVHAGGKPQSHHDDLHAQAREGAAKNMEKHGEFHLEPDHAPLPPGKVDDEEMYLHPKTRAGRDGPLRLGPENHTGFGHYHVDPPLHIDPHHDIHETHLNNPGVLFDERDEREHPDHPENEDYERESRQKHYEHRQWLKAYKEKHGIKELHPRRNKPKHHKDEELGYFGAQREKEGIPHPSEKYDYLHWEIIELRHEHDDAVHLYGENSDEAREINLLLKQLTSVDRAVDYLDWGMPQEEFDQLVEWMNEMHEVKHKHQVLTIEFDDGNHLDHLDREEKGAIMHEHAQELHKLEDREHELRELITASKQHHHLVYKPWENEGTIKERVKLREMYEKIHNTHDRDERLKLRNEYNERMETISTRRRYHSMPEDEKALIQDIREKIHDSQDEDEKAELRHEIEEIYMKHREERNTKGHMDDVHRPDVGMHRLEYNDMLHESDSQLLSYHDQLRKAKSAEEQRLIRIKIRDRVHELHHDGKKHPRHGVHA